MTTTQTVWFTRELVTVRHLRGLIEGLDQVGALDHAEVKIVAIPPDGIARLPKELVTSIGDHEVSPEGDLLLTYDNLPVQGILWAANEA